MSNLNSQLLSENATPQFSMLQSTNSAVSWLRKHNIYDDFSFESYSEEKPEFTKQSALYFCHSSEYVHNHNRIYPCILKAAEKYDERLSFLEEERKLDDVPLNPESMNGFMEFVTQCMPTISGGLVLIDNGNLRAAWNSDGESFVGLQFLNHQLIEYVLFSQTTPSLPVSRSFGQASIGSVMNQIEALELNWMLYEQC